MFPYAESTMWGPQPEKERKRLKPGDRMADGRIFMGDNPTAVLQAQLEQVQLELAPLEAKRDELLAKLAELQQLAATAAQQETPAPGAPKARSKGKRE